MTSSRLACLAALLLAACGGSATDGPSLEYSGDAVESPGALGDEVAAPSPAPAVDETEAAPAPAPAPAPSPTAPSDGAAPAPSYEALGDLGDGPHAAVPAAPSPATRDDAAAPSPMEGDDEPAPEPELLANGDSCRDVSQCASGNCDYVPQMVGGAWHLTNERRCFPMPGDIGVGGQCDANEQCSSSLCSIEGFCQDRP